MKKIIVSLLLVTVLVIPASASASSLSSQQISAILGLLQAFGASQDVINNVAKALGGGGSTSTNNLPSQYQISSILELLKSFGANPASITATNLALNGWSVSVGDTASLTEKQISAVIQLLQDWNINQSIINNVKNALSPALSSTQPSITVLSPNGGENWQVGKNYDVKWVTSGVKRLGFRVLKGSQVVYQTDAPLDSQIPMGTYINPDYYSKFGSGNDYRVLLYALDYFICSCSIQQACDRAVSY